MNVENNFPLPPTPPPSPNYDFELKRQKIKNSFHFSFEQYRKYSWGSDELLPNSLKKKEWLGLGLSIIDSIDTLWIMSETNYYIDARNWIKYNLKFNNIFTNSSPISVFESVIRCLGGLLSIYELSNDNLYLSKSIELGDYLLSAFDTPSQLPSRWILLTKRQPAHSSEFAYHSLLSEVGTIQMEFTQLSKFTNNPIYAEKFSTTNQ